MYTRYPLVIIVFSIVLLCIPYSLLAEAKGSFDLGNTEVFRDPWGVPHIFSESDAGAIGKTVPSWQFCQRLGKRCFVKPFQIPDSHCDSVTAAYKTIVAAKFCHENRKAELSKNNER